MAGTLIKRERICGVRSEPEIENRMALTGVLMEHRGADL